MVNPNCCFMIIAVAFFSPANHRGELCLMNPICFVLYGGILWVNFNERIIAEEESLYQFFGNAYSDYHTKVPVGIPFIRGFVPKDKVN